MKKNKLKALLKSARKATTQTIKLSLVAQLKENAEKLGIASKKTTKEIEKTAKSLAKKLSAQVKLDKDAIVKAATEAETKTVAAVKETPAAAPVKTAEPKAAKAAKPKAEKVTA